VQQTGQNRKDMNEFQHQKGRLSPSGFAAMMTNGRSKETIGKTAIEYANRIALERLGIEIPEAWSRAMEWGREWEEQGLAAYESLHGMVIPSGHIIHPNYSYVGGTPDGLIGDDGVLEIKCPYNPVNHLTNLTGDVFLEDYIYQVQGYLWITGRAWCDLVSFDPRYPLGLQLHVVRVDRDDSIISALAQRAELIEGIVQETIQKVKNNGTRENN